MKMIICIFVILSAVLFSTEKLIADTIPDNAEIYGLWSVENSPYIIMGEVTVPINTTLTIEAGVIIRIKSSTNDSAFIHQYLNVGLIRVLGNILAIGNENDSILISRMDDGKWGVIKFYNSSEGNIFKYCTISHAHQIYDELIPSEDFVGAIGSFNSDVLIENSTIKNNYIGIFSTNSEVTIVNSEVSFNQRKGIACYGSIVVIKNNHIYENDEDGIISNTSISLIRNNLIETNLRGIHSYESADSISYNILQNNLWCGIETTRNTSNINNNLIFGSNAGIRCEEGQPRLLNNTIVNNNYSGLYCGWEAKPIVVNSIIYGNQYLIYFNSDDTVVFANCLLQTDSLEPGLIDAGGNILNSDPLFSDTANYDFTLSGYSPCIDMGTAFFNWNDETILNLTPGQYYGNAPDMGAFESNFVKIYNNYSKSEIILYPNPTANFITITLKDNLNIEEAIIYNHLGQKALTAKPVNNMVDVSGLKPGVYILEVVTKNRTIREILLVE